MICSNSNNRRCVFERLQSSSHHRPGYNGDDNDDDATIILFANRLDVVPQGLQLLGSVFQSASSWLFTAAPPPAAPTAGYADNYADTTAHKKKSSASKDRSGQSQDFVHCVAPTLLGSPGAEWVADLSRSAANVVGKHSSSSSSSTSTSTSSFAGLLFDVGQKVVSYSTKLLLDAHGAEEHVFNLEMLLRRDRSEEDGGASPCKGRRDL